MKNDRKSIRNKRKIYEKNKIKKQNEKLLKIIFARVKSC